MAKYCLSYDAIDSSQWKPNELKALVSKVLIGNGAVVLQNPVASTIIFEDTEQNSNIAAWNYTIHENLADNIFYYLCAVAKTTSGNFLDRDEGNPDLNSNYKELLEGFE